MTRLMKSVEGLLSLFGLDPFRALRSLRGLPAYGRSYRALRRQRPTSARPFPFGRPQPCLGDRFAESGSAEGHYFHQDLLVARRVHANNPRLHADVGSRIDGFVAHVAAFRPIQVFDIRPLPNTIPNVTFLQLDLMAPLPEALRGYCDSLSCLHALEHFGLGRYGDPVNYDGYLQGLDNLTAMLEQGGKLYLSVPIGPQRIEFNAHRVFSVGTLLECVAGAYDVDRFAFVDDAGALHEDVPLTADAVANSFGCFYGCGIFELTKRKS